MASLFPYVPHLLPKLPSLLLTILLLRRILHLLRAKLRNKALHHFSNQNNCSSPPSLPTTLFGSLRHKLHLLTHTGTDLLDNIFSQKFTLYSPTHALCDSFGTPKVIHTIDPVNLNATLNKLAADWSPSESHARTMYPLAQEGLLNSEGAEWHKNRKLIMRHIGTKRARDVRNSEGDIQLLFEAIGPCDSEGWTETVDLLDLFHRLSLDMSTSFLLGTSAESQTSGLREKRKQIAMREFGLVDDRKGRGKMSYGEAYEIVRNFFSWRSKLGSKYWVADGLRYRKACATLNEFADESIAKAIQRSKEEKVGGGEEGGSCFALIDSLVRDIGDPLHIRNLVMDLFIAGQNMTGTMAAWVFAQLEAHPDIYDSVRSEVLEVFGTEDWPRAPLTWDNFRSCTEMQHVILETLRMYPLLANIGRNANKDTVLPRGGGEHGQQPIAVPKGAAVTCNVYLVHRRSEKWGDDAWEFKPDRWTGRKIKGGDYAPFGMGPRICPGQQLTMTEISFLMARMMQRFESIKAPEGQDNLTKGYRVVVAPKNGVKVQLKMSTGSAQSPKLGTQFPESPAVTM